MNNQINIPIFLLIVFKMNSYPPPLSGINKYEKTKFLFCFVLFVCLFLSFFVCLFFSNVVKWVESRKTTNKFADDLMRALECSDTSKKKMDLACWNACKPYSNVHLNMILSMALFHNILELIQFPRTAKSHGQRAAKRRGVSVGHISMVGQWNGLTIAISWW